MSRIPLLNLALPPSALAVLVLALAGVARASADIRITVTGNIAPECTLTVPAAQVKTSDITRAGSYVSHYTVNCNAPFRHTAVSLYGGLRRTEVTELPPGYAAQFPYTVAVNLPTDTGVIAYTCSSANMAGAPPSCGSATSGGGIAIGKEGTLTVSWQPQSNLMDGTYTDTITLTLETQV